MTDVVSKIGGTLRVQFEGVRNERNGSRIPFADNLKGLAIILVVAGHWLSHYTGLSESSDHALSVLYGAVYTIHMPTFALVTGYLAKSDGWTARGIRTTAWLIGVYLVASCIHSAIYALFYYEPGELVGLNHFVDWLGGYAPYSLWWLISLATWRTLLPLVQRVRQAFRSWLPLLFASLLAVVLCEFSLEDGAWLSIMRTVFFWPFFLVGHIIRDCKISPVSDKAFRKNRVLAFFGFAAIALIVVFVFSKKSSYDIYDFARMFLYGSNPVWQFDEPLDFLLVNLLFAYGSAVLLSVLLAVIVPKRICFLTSVGRYSLNVYLVHVMVLLIVSSPAIAQTSWGAALTDFVPLTLIGVVVVLVCSKGGFSKLLDGILRRLKCSAPRV